MEPRTFARRKLLLHKKEIRNLAAKVAQKGYTLVPTKLYLKDSHAKLEVALARGKNSIIRKRISPNGIPKRAGTSFSHQRF
jgi:tmRNA-binding protein